MELDAVLDFETTGLSPKYGDRATEIAVTLVRGGQVVDRFTEQTNFNWLSMPFEQLTLPKFGCAYRQMGMSKYFPPVRPPPA